MFTCTNIFHLFYTTFIRDIHLPTPNTHTQIKHQIYPTYHIQMSPDVSISLARERERESRRQCLAVLAVPVAVLAVRGTYSLQYSTARRRTRQETQEQDKKHKKTSTSDIERGICYLCAIMIQKLLISPLLFWSLDARALLVTKDSVR